MSTTTQTNIRTFQFKASFSPCLVFEIIQNDFDLLQQQLQETVNTTPEFFCGTTAVIDLSKLNEQAIVDFVQLKSLLQSHGITPIGIRGGTETQQLAAAAANLPKVNLGKSPARETSQPKTAVSTSKLITQPIRSGMQVYAKDGDLIITSQVSPGAELLADGHIHVYGSLKGRVLAGINGNVSARIFCRSLDAELIAIAGYYMTREELSALMPSSENFLQIYLQDDKLHIEPI